MNNLSFLQFIALSGLLLLAFSMPIYVVTQMAQPTRFTIDASRPDRITQPPIQQPQPSPLPLQAGCVVAGCSAELCIEAHSDLTSICEWRDEYSCYQDFGICHRQPNGHCGWTPTAELNSCLLERASNPNPSLPLEFE